MDQNNIALLNSTTPIHSSNMAHPKRKTNRYTTPGNLQTLTLGDEAKMVSVQIVTLILNKCYMS